MYSPFNSAPRQGSQTSQRSQQQPTTGFGPSPIRPLNQPIMQFAPNGQPEFDQSAVMANYQNMYPGQDPQALGNFADQQMQEFAMRYAKQKRDDSLKYGGVDIMGQMDQQRQAVRTPGRISGINQAPRGDY